MRHWGRRVSCRSTSSSLPTRLQNRGQTSPEHRPLRLHVLQAGTEYSSRGTSSRSCDSAALLLRPREKFDLSDKGRGFEARAQTRMLHGGPEAVNNPPRLSVARVRLRSPPASGVEPAERRLAHPDLARLADGLSDRECPT